MASFVFPVYYNGQVKMYTGQILIGRNRLNQEARKIRVPIHGVDLIYKLDKEGKLFTSVSSRGRNDPKYKRALSFPETFRFAVLKSLESYLVSKGNVKLTIRTAPFRNKRFSRL